MIDMALARIVGDSAPVRELRLQIKQLAPLRISVLIQGPTGSGKELVAHALHSLSGRSGRYVAVNVCALSDGMFESALFGHVRGAFTGAVADLPGYLAEANGGTLLLDEIGGLAMAHQPKLLRAMDSGEFRPVGARVDRRSDFRILAATNEPIEAMVGDGRFRADLRHRLAGVTVTVPPLRSRLDDVPILAQHFVRQSAASHNLTFSTAAMSCLQEHTWPGNVRELRHVIERTIAFAQNCRIDRRDVATAIAAGVQSTSDFDADHQERRAFVELLYECRWNTAEAADRLGVARSTVYRRMEKLAIRKCDPVHLPAGITGAIRSAP